MNTPSPPVEPRHTVWMDRFQALFEVLLLSGVVSSFIAAHIMAVIHQGPVDLMADATMVVAFLLLESTLLFILLLLMMKAHGETVSSLGFRWSRWKPDICTGLIIVPVLLAMNFVISLFFRRFLPEYHFETNPLLEIIQTPHQLLLFMFAVLVAGGVKEELQRAFILIRFKRHLGGAAAGLIIWSLVFGAGHHVQGVQGITVATLYGFVFGVIYLTRKSLIAPITAHSVYDLAVLLLYWNSSGR